MIVDILYYLLNSFAFPESICKLGMFPVYVLCLKNFFNSIAILNNHGNHLYHNILDVSVSDTYHGIVGI